MAKATYVFARDKFAEPLPMDDRGPANLTDIVEELCHSRRSGGCAHSLVQGPLHAAPRGLFSAISAASRYRRTLVLGPDDVWTTFLMGAVRHFNLSSPAYDKTLYDYGSSAGATKEKVAEAFVPGFSTSDDCSARVCEMLCTRGCEVKQLHDYARVDGEGMAGVELQGTDDDWARLFNRVKSVAELLTDKPVPPAVWRPADEWLCRLFPFLFEVLDTYSGTNLRVICTWENLFYCNTSSGLCEVPIPGIDERLIAAGIPAFAERVSDRAIVPVMCWAGIQHE
jgi:hypothetical protein